CVRCQDSSRTADLVQQGEDFDLRLHLFGHRFKDQVRLARRLLHCAGVLDARECRVGIGRSDLAQFDGLIEMGANLSLGATQRIGKQVFKNGAIATERGGMGNAAPHDAGADDRHRSDFRHYWPPFSRLSSTTMKLGSDLCMYSAKRLRSSGVKVGMVEVIRRSVAAISST